MASKSRTSCESKSAEDCARWMQRVHQVQSQRTPEAVEAARQRVERARQAEVSYRKCKAVKGHAVRSRALVAEGLGQMASSSRPEEHMAVQERWRNAQEVSKSRQVQALSRADQAAEQQPAVAALLEDASDEEDEAMEEVAQLVGAADPRSMALVGSEGLAAAAPRAGGAGSVASLLAQLRTEPSDESECAAKFMLYEGYASEVEQVRGSLLKFHSESRSTVPDAVAAGMEKQVESIDSQEAMGIYDDAREWFVFHMIRTAEKNNLRMAAILQDFEKKLEFLASNDQSECPVCLEAFAESGDHSAETLGCCHKVCRDCWEHWSAVMGGRPFCPLCKHEDFLGAVASRMPGQL